LYPFYVFGFSYAASERHAAGGPFLMHSFVCMEVKALVVALVQGFSFYSGHMAQKRAFLQI